MTVTADTPSTTGPALKDGRVVAIAGPVVLSVGLVAAASFEPVQDTAASVMPSAATAATMGTLRLRETLMVLPFHQRSPRGRSRTMPAAHAVGAHVP